MWTTRRAVDADLPALQELCTASVGPDDYVLGFLGRFVQDSVTLVAEDGPRIVGMMVYDDTPDRSVWLHAARTRPDSRRRGVATALNRACEALARRRGRTSLRLWADASNVPSAMAARGGGFEERARFTRMRITATRSASPPRLDPVALPRDWPELETSPLLMRSSGYVFHDFYFLPLTRANATWLDREHALWRFGENLVSISEDFEDLGGKDLQIQLLAGRPDDILRAAPGIASSRGADRVESFLPHDPVILETARRAGFDVMEWGREAILFEKPLLQ